MISFWISRKDAGMGSQIFKYYESCSKSFVRICHTAEPSKWTSWFQMGAGTGSGWEPVPREAMNIWSGKLSESRYRGRWWKNMACTIFISNCENSRRKCVRNCKPPSESERYTIRSSRHLFAGAIMAPPRGQDLCNCRFLVDIGKLRPREYGAKTSSPVLNILTEERCSGNIEGHSVVIDLGASRRKINT